jgi:type I restriction enzyme S subunit
MQSRFSPRPLKRCVLINPETLPEDYDPASEIEYVDIGNVEQMRGIVSTERMYFGDAPSRARRRVRDGDTIISTVRTYLKAVAPIENPPENLVVSTGFAVLRPGPDVHPKFLAWLAQSDGFVQRVEASSVGVSYPAISPFVLGSISVHLPPLDEQRTIADVLDRETARIDELIARTKSLVELLEECRFVNIFRLVTEGCRANEVLRESGIVWIRSIPRHWKAIKLKRVAQLFTGHTPSRQHPEYWVDCTIPWFSLADVWQLRDGRQEYIRDTDEKISELGLANSAARLLPANTVIVSRTASVGFSGIMAVPMATTQDFVNWVCGSQLIPEYLLYVFRAMTTEFRRLTQGSTHQTIYMPDVWSFATPLPPLSEQEAIVREIRTHTHRMDQLVDSTHRDIKVLREYRTALISAAVTGQIESALTARSLRPSWRLRERRPHRVLL